MDENLEASDISNQCEQEENEWEENTVEFARC